MRAAIFGLLPLLSALLISPACLADAAQGEDGRIGLGLTTSEKHALLTEMRQMLVSIQGIISGIGREDRELILRSARASGNQMARKTPASLQQKLPAAFKRLGGPTHMMFEELVIRADSDDMATLAEFTGQLMQQCIDCHARFKAD